MKTTLAERLKFARNLAGFSQKQLGERVGVTQAAIQKIEVGKASNSTRLIDIAKCLNVRPEWLSDGEEPMRSGLESNISPQGRGVETWDRSTPVGDDEVEIPYYKSIELAAGHGCMNNVDNNGYKLRFSRSTLRKYGAEPANVISFDVHGDSMAPVIPNRSTVTVDMGHTRVTDGGIYAIEQDDLFRIKLLYRLPGHRLSIRSYNRDEYPDEEADTATVKIIGRVINWSVMAW
ncbi:XRE family transcriptional regulator [Enterobacillus tribolii]|uniref:Phage repressor protein C with HTH and peptisase S24 domain n=1 Tax=Enterobacillus tribolii TaxID=1487935 RepID=A0A370R2Q7_9GAMM|nr:helix-turn-helix transcriptional regulator [Enterobacillus tribolii]MBW7984718.1 helix-turn-helix transcriptional regulator [Enterobacillus tribolii]RDK96717.1 phage repressor protein C with HTH and peptisase S24 domain [Enterobacillus tribolii]